MTAITRSIEALGSELGAFAARVERELQLRVDAMFAEMRARAAELELRAVNAERALSDRMVLVKDGEPGASVTIDDVAPLIASEVARAVSAIPVPKDGDPGPPVDQSVVVTIIAEKVAEAIATLPEPQPGKDADPALIAELVAVEVAKLPPATPGRDAEPEMVRAMVADAVAALPPAPAGKDADMDAIRAMVRDAVSELPPAPPGKDADPETIRQMVAEAIAALPAPEPGPKGDPGQMPIAKEWTDVVHYLGDVVTHDGGTYQATRDTGREPPHADWICIASAGAPGVDGRGFDVRGTWSETEEYRALDIVAFNGGSFVAKTDSPGPCPGPGWQLWASPGKKGGQGDPGRKGDPGPCGPPVVGASVDDEGVMTLRNADGSVVTCDFYPVLIKVQG